jgi:hypothetical protein
MVSEVRTPLSLSSNSRDAVCTTQDGRVASADFGTLAPEGRRDAAERERQRPPPVVSSWGLHDCCKAISQCKGGKQSGGAANSQCYTVSKLVLAFFERGGYPQLPAGIGDFVISGRLRPKDTARIF